MIFIVDVDYTPRVGTSSDLTPVGCIDMTVGAYYRKGYLALYGRLFPSRVEEKDANANAMVFNVN